MLLHTLKADFKIIFEQDPSANNWLEVLMCYPGLQALLFHRIAHWLYCLKLPLIPRLICYFSRWLTGIEIHPGAKIGTHVFIDHGMGVVIGETAIVGDYALIYQDVTLGGTGKDIGKRHPSLGKNVIVGAGAKVLGNIQIGDHVRIGEGSVILQDIPSNCTVVGVPGKIVRYQGQSIGCLEYHKLPDPPAEVIYYLSNKVQCLEKKIEFLKLILLQNQNNSAAIEFSKTSVPEVHLAIGNNQDLKS
jgi:serine O-acetyltransferase